MAVTRSLTLDEFLLLPEERPALEYERGEITQKLDPMVRHSAIQSELAMRMSLHNGGRQILALGEVCVTWPTEETSFVPDVIAYRIERVPVDKDGLILNHLTVPPDVAVEISAPGQEMVAQMDRCRWYVQHGVPVALLVRPDRRAVWAFRPDGETGPFQGADTVDLGDAIPGFSIAVADVFAALRVDN